MCKRSFSQREQRDRREIPERSAQRLRGLPRSSSLSELSGVGVRKIVNTIGYTTNLKVSSAVIYSLYRLRWQLELPWKSWKSYLHFDEISTANKNIIQSIILTEMIAGLMAGAISVSIINQESEEKQAAFSLQKCRKNVRKNG